MGVLGFASDRLRNIALSVPRLRALRDHRDRLALELADRERELADCERERAACERRPAASPFYHYNAMFDPLEVIRRHAVRGLRSTPGYLTNFLGVLIDPDFAPTILSGRGGEVEGIPVPSNWHADIAEWGAALRAVDLARGGFTVLELGCGWGCWMNNTGVAARRAGLEVDLIGIEADEAHLGSATACCAANGFAPGQVTLFRGVAAAGTGVALFPRPEAAGTHWGLEPVFGATAEQREGALASGRFDEVAMLPLESLAARRARIDLLHIDIQGGEAELIVGSLAVLREKVAYIVVGTHSRQIEGRIMDALLGDGWTLEIERPAILALAEDTPRVTVDGVQGWRNPRLAAH
jgi:hypothetical protein